MPEHEIVGVIIDGNRVCCDAREIHALRALGIQLEYVSRARAEHPADARLSELAVGPTLFVVENGVVFW